MAPPPGFVIGGVIGGAASSNLPSFDEVLQEIRRQTGKGRLASIGVDYDSLRLGKPQIRSELALYPKLSQLLKYVTQSKWGDEWSEDRLNIIVNCYDSQNAHKLHAHKDSFRFEDSIYGLVIKRDSGAPCLSFTGPNGERYSVPEEVGSYFKLEGDSRFIWKHFCKSGQGERISITWRWVRKESMAYAWAGEKMRKEWIRNFTGQAGIGSNDREVIYKDCSMYQDQNEDFGPSLALPWDGSATKSTSSSSAKPLNGKANLTSDERINNLLKLRDMWASASPVDNPVVRLPFQQCEFEGRIESRIKEVFEVGSGKKAWDHQVDAVQELLSASDGFSKALERGGAAKGGALDNMATGSGKTRVIACFVCAVMEAGVADLVLVANMQTSLDKQMANESIRFINAASPGLSDCLLLR